MTGFVDRMRAGWAAAMDGPAPADQRDAADDRFFETGARRSEIQVDVTVARARQVPVIKDCLKVKAETVAGLEFGLFRRINARTRERLDDHPFLALLERPNPRQTSFEFLLQLCDDLNAFGNAMTHTPIGEDGEVASLERIDPDPMKTTVDEVEGVKRFRTYDRNGIEQVYLEDEVWHIAVPPTKDGLIGRSPILDDGLEAVAVAIALQRYANILFTNDATPTYAYSMDGHFASEDDKRRYLGALRRWLTGKFRHYPGILEYGLKPHRMGLTAEEAQFLETRRELWLDLTRLWRVPPHKVGMLDRATNNNIEHQGLEFVTDCLRADLELIERSITRHMIPERDVYFEFNVDSLLRGDIKARFEAYALGRQWGWYSVNDILHMERRNGIGPAGDRYIEPLNMVPVGTGAPNREPDRRESIDRSIAFLRESVAQNGGRPRLEVVKDAA